MFVYKKSPVGIELLFQAICIAADPVTENDL